MTNLDPNTISDEELVKHCLADERSYQEILYRRFAGKMYNVALTYAKNDDEACDILQEGFINVFRKLNQFKFESPLEGWVRKIIVNKALEIYRQKKRREEVTEDYTSDLTTFTETILESINAKEIVNFINELPQKAAMVLKLYAIEGYAHNEIADLMDISVGTSKSQLNRARALLKEKIDQSNG